MNVPSVVQWGASGFRVCWPAFFAGIIAGLVIWLCLVLDFTTYRYRELNAKMTVLIQADAERQKQAQQDRELLRTQIQEHRHWESDRAREIEKNQTKIILPKIEEIIIRLDSLKRDSTL